MQGKCFEAFTPSGMHGIREKEHRGFPLAKPSPPQSAPWEEGHTREMFWGDSVFIAANRSKQSDKLLKKSGLLPAVRSQKAICLGFYPLLTNKQEVEPRPA